MKTIKKLCYFVVCSCCIQQLHVVQCSGSIGISLVAVTVKSLTSFKRPVKLAEIKKSKDFVDLALVKQSRLSVMEIDLKSWKKICKMGKVQLPGVILWLKRKKKNEKKRIKK